MENEKYILGLLKFFWTKRTKFKIVKLLEKQRVWVLPSFNDMAGSDPGTAERGLKGRIPLAGAGEISLLSVTRKQMALLGWVGSQASHFSNHFSVADSTLRCGTGCPNTALTAPVRWIPNPCKISQERERRSSACPVQGELSSRLQAVTCKLLKVIKKQ